VRVYHKAIAADVFMTVFQKSDQYSLGRSKTVSVVFFNICICKAASSSPTLRSMSTNCDSERASREMNELAVGGSTTKTIQVFQPNQNEIPKPETNQSAHVLDGQRTTMSHPFSATVGPLLSEASPAPANAVGGAIVAFPPQTIVARPPSGSRGAAVPISLSRDSAAGTLATSNGASERPSFGFAELQREFARADAGEGVIWLLLSLSLAITLAWRLWF
jgi:hypothetical protein